MLQSRIAKIFTAVVSIAIIVAIFLNPLTHGSGDLLKIKMISNGLNEILKATGASGNINSDKMINIIIFIEYAFFGVSLMFTTEAFCKNTIKNIFFPLFVGLFSSVGMGYYGYKFHGLISGIGNVVTMFWGLILGIAIYLLTTLVLNGAKSNGLRRKSKYRRGR